MSPRILTITISLFMCSTSLASTAPVFFDSFDSEPGAGSGQSGLSETNYDGFANWVISQGSVDLLAHGDFGPIDCADFAGKCVDLDGTSNGAGVMTSVDIALDAGRYKFEMLLAGVSANFGQSQSAAPNAVDISISGIFATTELRNQGDPFVQFVREFEVNAPTVVNIVIANNGGDNFGAILDNVSVTPIPVSAGLWLFVGSVLYLARNRKLSA